MLQTFDQIMLAVNQLILFVDFGQVLLQQQDRQVSHNPFQHLIRLIDLPVLQKRESEHEHFILESSYHPSFEGISILLIHDIWL